MVNGEIDRTPFYFVQKEPRFGSDSQQVLEDALKYIAQQSVVQRAVTNWKAAQPKK